MDIIQKAAIDAIPEGAVRISKEEAIIKQWGNISNWEPKSDVWFLRFGAGILSATTIISSTLIMQHYRRKLKLHTYGRIVTFIPGVIFPALSIPFIRQKAVTEPILLQDHCPVCIQVRSVTIQSIAGIAYPILVHSIGSVMLAHQLATYRLPDFSLRRPGEIWSFWRMINKRVFSSVPMYLLLQVAMSIFITEMEAKEFFNILNTFYSSQQRSEL